MKICHCGISFLHPLIEILQDDLRIVINFEKYA